MHAFCRVQGIEQQCSNFKRVFGLLCAVGMQENGAGRAEGKQPCIICNQHMGGGTMVDVSPGPLQYSF